MSAILPVKHSYSLDALLPSHGYLRTAARALPALILLAVLVTIIALTLPGARSGDIEQLPPSTSGPLVARSATAVRDHGFFVVQGEAVNQSSQPGRRLEAVVELFDTRGALRTVDSALVEMPLIAPHEESPFVVHLRDPGDIRAFRVRFRPLGTTPLR